MKSKQSLANFGYTPTDVRKLHDVLMLTLYATGRPVLDDFIFQIVMKIGQKDTYVDSKKQFWAFPDKINFGRFMASGIFWNSSEMAMCRRC